MITAVLLDFGGTLDGDGRHWLDRCRDIWASFGAGMDETRLKEAFYEADRRLEADPTIPGCGLVETMRRHAAWQLRYLGLDDPALGERLAAAFAGPAGQALERSRAVLERLHHDGYRLGVLSNFYGNVAALCDEAGLTPLLDVVLDSAVAGLRKPDLAFFEQALAGMAVQPAETVMVGDSFERDIRPAHALGMRTLWLAPGRRDDCPEPALADGVLESLSELPEQLKRWVTS
jgi:putative hydrolase of the HAD superfamily